MFEEVLVTEVIGMDIVLASQASHIMRVQLEAARSVHLKACVMMPRVHNTNLRVVGCESIADCSDQICTVAPLWRLCHTALLADGWATKHGILISVKLTELLRSDLRHACRAFQGFPIATHCVHVMASATSPRDLMPDFAIVPGEAVSHGDGIQHIPAPLRLFSRYTTVLPCEADLGMVGGVF